MKTNPVNGALLGSKSGNSLETGLWGAPQPFSSPVAVRLVGFHSYFGCEPVDFQVTVEPGGG